MQCKKTREEITLATPSNREAPRLHNLTREDLEAVGIRPFEDEAIASAELAGADTVCEEHEETGCQTCKTAPSDELFSSSDREAPKEAWETEFDSMFDWADQVKERELGHWKIMYGFQPKDLKDFIRSLLSDQRRSMVEEYGKTQN